MGQKEKKHQDWFDDNGEELLKLTKAKESKKNQWWLVKAAELQELADTHKNRAFFAATKMVYGPSTHGPTPLRTSTNELVKDPESIRLCWKEHFNNFLNRNAQVDPRAVDELEQHLVRHELAVPPSLDEVEKALRSLKSGKASGPDGIPAEVIKAGGSELAEQLFLLIQKFWTEEQIPADLRDALIVTLFKKGDKSLCSNYRGISLLSAVGKLFAKIPLIRLTPLAEQVLPESQCGFRPSRGTIDMIFALRQIQEKCREQRRASLPHLYRPYKSIRLYPSRYSVTNSCKVWMPREACENDPTTS